jgi:L-asparaginase II
MSAPLVELMRGGLVDEIHRGDLAVVSADGELRFSVGDPVSKIAFWRSSAKPFQAMPLIASGAAARLGLSREDIALMAASHGGEPVHVAAALALLERVGHTPDELECGAHAPLDAGAARALEREGVEPSALHNNCSGKHAGMLALADQLDAPCAGYRRAGHPVQRTILENVARFTGLGPPEIALGLDGCGVPCFGIAVSRMALAFARLMAPPDDLPVLYRDAAEVVREAIMGQPYLIAGRRRIDTDLMQALPGAIVSKGGAGGVQCVGLPGGIGIALKIENGATAAAAGGVAGVAALAALRQLGVLDDPAWDALAAHASPEIRSVAGERAGAARAVFELAGSGPSGRRRPASRT